MCGCVQAVPHTLPELLCETSAAFNKHFQRMLSKAPAVSQPPFQCSSSMRAARAPCKGSTNPRTLVSLLVRSLSPHRFR